MSRGKYGKLYAIRSRVREQSEITIHGGTKIGSHRRRVSRWSKWQLRAYEGLTVGACVGLARIGDEPAVTEFHDGVRWCQTAVVTDDAGHRVTIWPHAWRYFTASGTWTRWEPHDRIRDVADLPCRIVRGAEIDRDPSTRNLPPLATGGA